MTRFVVLLIFAGLMVQGGVVSAQNYPAGPIRIVTGDPGGGLDFAARLIASGLSGSLGQQVIVDNRGTFQAPQIVGRAPADGYTLLFYGSPFWLAPFLREKVPYDPVKDFSPITLATSSIAILVVNSSVAANTVKELIALAKARPGGLNYALSSIGTSGHLAMEVFKAMAGVNIVAVPYRGSGPALNALIGNEVQLMIATGASVAPQIKSGRLKALAVTSAQPSALFTGVPTVAASGLPGFNDLGTVYAVFAPAQTPAILINQLNQEIVRVLNRTNVKEKLLASGVEVVGSSPEALAAAMKYEMITYGKIIKDAGIRAE